MPKLPQIKIGETQPVDCPNCEESHGYQYSDYMRIHYTTFHDSDGYHEGGAYSDFHRIINKGSTPYCCNCGTRLQFKIERTFDEIVQQRPFSTRGHI